MPQIPRYEGSGTLSKQAPQVRVQPAAQDVRGKALEQTGQQLQRLHEHFASVDNNNRSLKAQRDLNRDIEGVKSRASQDPDLYRNQALYEEELTALRGKYGQDIYDREMANVFEAKAEGSLDSAFVTIRDGARKNAIQVALGNQAENEQAYKERYMMAPHTSDGAKEMQDVLASYASDLDSLRAIGALTPKQVAEEKAKYVKDWAEARVLYDIESRRLTKDQIEKAIDAGVYGPLDLEQKTDLKEVNEKTWNTQLERADKELKRAQAKGDLDLAVRLVSDKPPSLAEIKDLAANEQISLSGFRKAWEFVTSEKDVTEADNYRSYTEIRKMILDGKSFQDVQTAISEAIMDRKIKGAQARQLIEKAAPDQDKTSELNKIESIEGDQIKATLGRALFSEEITYETAPVQITNAINQYQALFHRKVHEMKDPTPEKIKELSRTVTESALREIHPELQGVDEIPDVLVDASGAVTRLFVSMEESGKREADFTITPDGRITKNESAAGGKKPNR